MKRLWMVRSEGGTLYDIFKDYSIVAIGWEKIAQFAIKGMSKQQLQNEYLNCEPNIKKGNAISGASQVWRFVNEIQIDDWVVTYSPTNRTYLLGKVLENAQYHIKWVEKNMSLARKVEWLPFEISRDNLSNTCKNSLGSISTIFELSKEATKELLSFSEDNASKVGTVKPVLDENVVEDYFKESELNAFEKIKDIVNNLDWEDMQKLVAGVLRSMGYKTQISSKGADRGKDIIASPDGFGFEHPRIIVEVKHRQESMGSSDIRSFTGARHKDDRGLYVSTGGFTKEAKYEAERAHIPVMLWSLEELVRALLEHYESIDLETRQLVPLKRLYFPV